MGNTGYRRNPGTPIGQHLSLGVYAALPESARSFALRSSSRAHGCKIGLERFATRNEDTPGRGRCAESSTTGPVRLVGGRKACPIAIQPVVRLGEKSGAF